MTTNRVAFLRKAWLLYREQGGLKNIYRRLRRSLWYSFSNDIVYRKTLGDVNFLDDHPGVIFRRASTADIHWISENMPHLGDKAEALLNQQFSGKDMTIIGVSKEQSSKLIFIVWLSRSDFGMTLLGEQVEDFDASLRRYWVPESHRRLGLAFHGGCFVEQIAWRAGIKNLWSFVLKDNLASRRLHEKLGYENLGSIRLLARFGKRYAVTRIQGERKRRIRIPNDRSKF